MEGIHLLPKLDDSFGGTSKTFNSDKTSILNARIRRLKAALRRAKTRRSKVTDVEL